MQESLKLIEFFLQLYKFVRNDVFIVSDHFATFVVDKVWREFEKVLQKSLFEYSRNFARHVRFHTAHRSFFSTEVQAIMRRSHTCQGGDTYTCVCFRSTSFPLARTFIFLNAYVLFFLNPNLVTYLSKHSYQFLGLSCNP